MCLLFRDHITERIALAWVNTSFARNASEKKIGWQVGGPGSSVSSGTVSVGWGSESSGSVGCVTIGWVSKGAEIAPVGCAAAGVGAALGRTSKVRSNAAAIARRCFFLRLFRESWGMIRKFRPGVCKLGRVIPIFLRKWAEFILLHRPYL